MRLAVLALGLPLLVACRGGNGASSTTGWTVWSDDVNATRTRAYSVPASEWKSLLTHVPRGHLDHHDFPPARAGHVALVVVRPRYGRRFVPPVAHLLTELELADGRLIRRSWQARAGSAWFAIFSVELPVLTAATAILP